MVVNDIPEYKFGWMNHFTFCLNGMTDGECSIAGAL